jgi:integrase
VSTIDTHFVEGDMAWVEQIGTRSWRVRYRRDDGTHGSFSGFHSKKAAQASAHNMEADQRRGTWLDPAGAQTTVAEWIARWVDTLDVEIRTEENYRGRIQNHILPRWGTTRLGDITALAVTAWIKDLRQRFAASTVPGIITVFSMMLDDAVDERLIPANPVHRRRHRGRRHDHHPSPAERVWATPEQVLAIAEQAARLAGPTMGLLIITAGWTGARWGELTGLHRDNVNLTTGTITIDPHIGALHESNHKHWVGPPKTPASVRTIALPPFLTALLRNHLRQHPYQYVFTTPSGTLLWRSTFDRRVLRPAADGNHHTNPTVRTEPIRPGLTFHGLRHSHKTWLIADNIPEIAQARRLGHHLTNRLIETYSHVAPEIEHRLLHALQHRWNHALKRPTPPRPPQPTHDPHTRPARVNSQTRRRPTGHKPRRRHPPAHNRSTRPPEFLQNRTQGHRTDNPPTINENIRKAPPTSTYAGTEEARQGSGP